MPTTNRVVHTVLVLALWRFTAALVITHQPFVDVITHSQARILWKTDLSAISSIKYGLASGSLNLEWKQRGTATTTVPQVSLTGLQSSTKYYFSVCSTLESTTVCSIEGSFTTLADRSMEPTPPEEFDTPVPVQDGEKLYVGEDCNDPKTGLQALLDKAKWGDTILLSPNTVCSGAFHYKEKEPDKVTPHRWIVLRTDIDDDRLPPEGVRVNPELYRDSMAIIQYSNSNMRPLDNVPVIGTTCMHQGYSFHPFVEYIDTFDKFPMYWCGFSEARKFDVLGATYDGSGITLTVSDASSIAANQRAYVDGIQGLNFFGVFTVASVSGNTITFAQSGIQGSYTGGGFVKMVEWQVVPYTNGTSRPTSACSPGDWFHDTNHGHVYMCSEQLKGGTGWNFMVMSTSIFSNDVSAGLQMRAKAHHLYIQGITFTVVIPEARPEYGIGFSQMSNFPQGVTYSNIVSSGTSNHHIVIDRCEVNGQIGRARVLIGLALNGKYMALLNSYIHGIGYWHNESYWGVSSSQGISIPFGTGPGKIYNNHIEAYGLSLFFSDDAGSCVTLPADYIVDRNHFVRDEKYRYGSDTYAGLVYPIRQMGEHKVGRRVRWSGNKFLNNWVQEVLNGACMALTPRPGDGTLYQSITNGKIVPYVKVHEWAVSVGDIVLINPGSDRIMATVTQVDPEFIQVDDTSLNFSVNRFWCLTSEANWMSDFLVEANYFWNSPSGLFTIGHHGGTPDTPPFSRLKVVNNLFHDMNTKRSGFGPQFGGGYLYYTVGGPEDHIFDHNTGITLNGDREIRVFSLDADGSMGKTEPGNRFEFKNNLLFWSPSNWILGTSGADGKYWGTASMNAMWTDWDASQTLVLGSKRQADYPDALLWELNYTDVLTDAPAGDYSILPSSPYKNAGTDGTDLGYDFDRYEVLQGVVKNVAVNAAGGTVTFNFRAPDAQQCHVDLYQNNQFLQRVKNNGSQRDQTVSATLPKGEYKYYILCAAEQPSGVIYNDQDGVPSSQSPSTVVSSATATGLSFVMYVVLVAIQALAV